MKFVRTSCAGALLLSAGAAAAAPVTYTIKGNFDAPGRLEGRDAALLSAAMGTPSTYEARFTFDPAQAQMGNVLYVNGIAATVKIDGQSVGNFMPQYPGQNIVMFGSSGGNNGMLDFRVLANGDLFPNLSGGFEGIVFEIKLYGREEDLPANGQIPSSAFTFVNSSVELQYTNFDVRGPQPVSSLVERVGTAFGTAVTSLEVSPAPEPTEWSMMAAGLLVAGAAARGRRRAG